MAKGLAEVEEFSKRVSTALLQLAASLRLSRLCGPEHLGKTRSLGQGDLPLFLQCCLACQVPAVPAFMLADVEVLAQANCLAPIEWL